MVNAVGDFLSRLFGLEGRVAIITGAARGNGLAIAQALLRAGADALMVDRLDPKLSNAVSELRAEGLCAHALIVDLEELGAAARVCRAALEISGRIDVLVNNAGITRPAAYGEYPDSYWEETHRVNLKAPFELCREIGRIMELAGRGSIINVTSLNAEMGFPGNPAYVAFKGGLKQLTKALASELGPSGVRVNNLGPGYFRTDMTQGSWSDEASRLARIQRTMLGRWGEPADLAGAAVFLASDASAYITGQDIYVDGGWLAKGL